jgi:RNA polymerase sigma-70 factor (ECF subfamily)
MTQDDPIPFETLDEAEFSTELVANLPKLRRAARAITGRAQAADDLVQDAVVKAMSARLSFRAGTNMGAWLCFIARNVFLSEKRRSWRMVEMADGQAERVPAPASQLTRVLANEGFAALAYLPDEMREALLLVGMDGSTYEEAAEILKTEVGTVKSRVSRGRQILADYFGVTSHQGAFG